MASDEAVQEISPADDADKLSVMNHWNALDAVLFENLGNFFEQCVVVNRNELARHYVSGAATMRFDVVDCAVFGKQK